MQRRRHPRASRSSVSLPRKRHPLTLAFLAIFEALVITLLLLAMAACVYFAYQRLTKEAFFPLRRVILAEPLRYGSSDDIAEIVARSGQRDLIRLDVQKLAKEISAISWVRDVEVEKRWPDSVYIRVAERYPIATWDNDYLDKDGVRFSLPAPPQETLFALVGPEGYEQKVLKRYREMEPWLLGQKVPMDNIRLDPRLIWHIGIPGGIDVILGRDELNKRLKKLAIVYRRVIKPYQQYIDTVDLRYQDGFSVRWKPGVRPESHHDKQH